MLPIKVEYASAVPEGFTFVTNKLFFRDAFVVTGKSVEVVKPAYVCVAGGIDSDCVSFVVVVSAQVSEPEQFHRDRVQLGDEDGRTGWRLRSVQAVQRCVLGHYCIDRAWCRRHGRVNASHV